MIIGVMVVACILMLIDTKQTYRILKDDMFYETNPIINFLYNNFGMKGMLLFKVPLSFIPFISGGLGASGLALFYSYVVYHNYTGFRDYDSGKDSNNIHRRSKQG